jgi:hypothetical protein
MGQRQLLKEGVLFKAKSGRKLRGFLCSDIIVLTDDTAKSLYRMVRHSLVHAADSGLCGLCAAHSSC